MTQLSATVLDLKTRKAELYRQARALEDAITALQATCTHDWKDNGHGHNEDYEICRNCGLETSS